MNSKSRGYLSQCLAPSSIPKYLNMVRIMHLEQGLPDPTVLHMFQVKQVLTGVNKDKCTMVKRMKPITLETSLRMQHGLKTSWHGLNTSSIDIVLVWAACLLGFYGASALIQFVPTSLDCFKQESIYVR